MQNPSDPFPRNIVGCVKHGPKHGAKETEAKTPGFAVQKRGNLHYGATLEEMHCMIFHGKIPGNYRAYYL